MDKRLLDNLERNQCEDVSRKGGRAMPKFMIERVIPGAGKLSAAELQGISQKSTEILAELGPKIQWIQSYVTGDKVYCVYIAPDEQTIRDHAAKGGFPVNQISVVTSIIDPTTAETV
jgi:hypothetical protein